MKKPLPVARLILDIIAPEPELARTGACYATLRRTIELPFATLEAFHDVQEYLIDFHGFEKEV